MSRDRELHRPADEDGSEDNDGRPFPVAPAGLGPRAAIGLWALRVVAVALTGMVAWAFVVDLARGATLP